MSEHYGISFQVYDNSESIRAETIHCAREHVVLEFPTEMFQIQSCLQNCIQRAGRLSNLRLPFTYIHTF